MLLFTKFFIALFVSVVLARPIYERQMDRIARGEGGLMAPALQIRAGPAPKPAPKPATPPAGGSKPKPSVVTVPPGGDYREQARKANMAPGREK
jgi:hypothetical protein